ncbi:MAG TPA: hypothetical protein VLC95_17020, partial [Anaerolineae bacterium]|nr:hypothetical protein [Anaerolineae bacterium]
LVQHLAQQIDGLVEVSTDPAAGGTRVDVTFAGRARREADEGQGVDLVLDSVSTWQPARVSSLYDKAERS